MKHFAIAAAVLIACSAPAWADPPSCQLKLANTVPLTMEENGLRALAPVTINGSSETMLLDTGGVATQLSPDAIKKLGLVMQGSNIKLLTMYGGAAQGLVTVNTLVLGHLKDSNTDLLVSPFNFGGDPPVAGILAVDYMGRYDLEFDFANARLNYLSPDHCPGKVVYWPAAAGTILPMKLIDNHIRINVTLDGHEFRAIIDTGAPNTSLSAAAAKRVFDVTEDTPDVRKLHGEKGEMEFQKVFDSLSLGDIAVGHPHINIMPDLVGKHDPNNDYVTGSRVHRVDDLDGEPPMIIGMNILTKLRFVVAFSEDKIYLTPATPPAAH